MFKQPILYYSTNLNRLSLSGTAIVEQETTISIQRDSDLAYIETTDPTMFTKLKKRVNENPEEWAIADVTTAAGGDPNIITSAVFTCPKKYVSFRSKTVSREMSEEERLRAGERLRNLRKTRA